MSEQKDPNEINFDDEFLDIDFGNDSSGTDVNIDMGLNELLDNPTPNINLTDEFGANHLAATPTTEQQMPDDDFFKQLDSLHQEGTGDTPTQNTSITNTPHDNINQGMDTAETALLGAAVVGTGLAANQISDKPVAKKGMGGLFAKKPKTEKAPKPQKPAKALKAPKQPKPAGAKNDLLGLLSDPKKLNKLILGAVIALILIGVALYMAMSGDDNVAPPPKATAPTPVSTPAPQQTPQPESAPTPEQVAPAQTDVATPPASGDILPEIKPVVNPDEILNAEIPSDPALIKEEIDRLTDKESQIAEQEKLIQEQLSMMEDLTTAKAEQIALLEAQIAELEKQANSEAAPAPNAEQK